MNSLLHNKYILAFGMLIFVLLGVYTFNKTSQSFLNPISSPAPTVYKTPEVISPSENSEAKLLEKLKNRQPLTPADHTAKKTILTLLPPNTKSGIVYKSQAIIIEYLAPLDEFQVKILSTDITGVSVAKRETVSWFLAQGVSMEGLCNYPVSFYLSTDTADIYRQQHATFSPLPDGC